MDLQPVSLSSGAQCYLLISTATLILEENNNYIFENFRFLNFLVLTVTRCMLFGIIEKSLKYANDSFSRLITTTAYPANSSFEIIALGIVLSIPVRITNGISLAFSHGFTTYTCLCIGALVGIAIKMLFSEKIDQDLPQPPTPEPSQERTELIEPTLTTHGYFRQTRSGNVFGSYLDCRTRSLRNRRSREMSQSPRDRRARSLRNRQLKEISQPSQGRSSNTRLRHRRGEKQIEGLYT